MDPHTTALVVLSSVFIAGVLATLLSFPALWLYRRQVMRGMATFGQAEALPPNTEDVKPSAPASDLEILDAAANNTWKAAASIQKSLWTSRGIYVAGGLSLAGVVNLFSHYHQSRLDIYAFLLAATLWPTVLVLSMATVIGRKRVICTAATYLIALILFGFLLRPQNLAAPLSRIGDMFLIFSLMNVPTLFILGFLWRRIRGAQIVLFAPVFAGMALCQWLIFFFASMLDNGILGYSGTDVLHRAAKLRGETGIDAFWALGGLGLFGGIVGGVLAAWIIATLYRRKRMSDLSLALDLIIAIFAFYYTFMSVGAYASGEGIGGLLVFPLGLLAYKLVIVAGFRFILTRDDHAPQLLFLRVFALGARGEKFFDDFAKAWLRIGSISLIAGPDLATSIVKPHEFLTFLSGRLSRMFLARQSDVDRALQELDLKPDPDGRYRINQFLCRDDTWLLTMRRLAKQSNAVLMDLRGFSQKRRGCQQEIQEVLDHVALDRFIIVVDETTNFPFLAESLQSAWRGLSGASPNRVLLRPKVFLFRVCGNESREVYSLTNLLLSSSHKMKG